MTGSTVLKRVGLPASAHQRPEQSWRALVDSGATHVIVHEDAFARNRGSDVSAWLITRGARAIGVWGPDLLFELRPQPLDN